MFLNDFLKSSAVAFAGGGANRVEQEPDPVDDGFALGFQVGEEVGELELENDALKRENAEFQQLIIAMNESIRSKDDYINAMNKHDSLLKVGMLESRQLSNFSKTREGTQSKSTQTGSYNTPTRDKQSRYNTANGMH